MEHKMKTNDLVRGFFDDAAAGHPYTIEEIREGLGESRTAQAVRMATRELIDEGYLEHLDPDDERTEGRKMAFARVSEDERWDFEDFEDSEDPDDFKLFGRYTVDAADFLGWLATQENFGELLAGYSEGVVPSGISEGSLVVLDETEDDEATFAFRILR